MPITPPVVGDASVDEVDERFGPAVEVPREVFDGAHLCQGCMHQPVCAIALAARQLGIEDTMTISACGAFKADGPSLSDLVALSEEGTETDGED